ncbi:hypothetical protein PL81_08090 [Streptomyces sp. RSD-27]|nr:hypothetical protein PL81_08090 [Streptomyces sp. RSD-27]
MPGRMRLMTSMVPAVVSRMARTRSFTGLSQVVMVSQCIQPPSMVNDCAVMNDALELARKAMAAATSSGWPRRGTLCRAIWSSGLGR